MTLRDLRESRGVTRQELAQALGHKNADLLSKLERGDREMSRETLDHMAAPLAPLPDEVDLLLFTHRLLLDRPAEPGLTGDEQRRIDGTVLGASWTVARVLRPALLHRKKAEKAAAERREAEELWSSLKFRSPQERRDLADLYGWFQSCALVAQVCEASVRAAAHRVADATELADFARFIAERVEKDRRPRALGYAVNDLVKP
jgi:transcriptional regulator with XRE-family HTH domain